MVMTHFSRLRQLLLLQPKFLSSQPRPLRSPPPTFLRSVMGSSSSFSSSSSKLLFRQLFENESSTFTYLLADVSHPDKPALVCFCFLKIEFFDMGFGFFVSGLCFSNPSSDLHDE